MKKYYFLMLIALVGWQYGQAQSFFDGGIMYQITSPFTVQVGDQGGAATGAVTIPAQVTYNGDFFAVTNIGFYAFNNCTGLISVTIPNSVTSIGDAAFNSCSNLTSVTIPNSVTSIGYGAFAACSGLTSITIPNSVTSIGAYAFASCYGLTSITIPNSVTSIGYSAFNFCFGLTSITVPNSVTSIGENAFAYCFNLTSVLCDLATPLSINANVFLSVNQGACSLTVPAASVAAYQAASVWQNFSPITSVCMPTDNITAISACGTYTWLNNGQTYTTSGIYTGTTTNCVTEKLDLTITPSTDNITTITACDTYTWVNNGQTYITSGIYTGTTTNCVTEKLDLTITTPPTNFTSGGINYVLTSPTTVAVGSNPIASGVIVIPISVSIACGSYSVTSIGDFAFSSCSSLTSVTIPNSVTSIGFLAFASCSGLTSVTIPNSVTSIGTAAFAACYNLTSVTIPNSVTSIGSNAFNSCFGLTSVICDIATPLSISPTVFQGVNQGVCSLTVPAASVAAYQAAPFWQNFAPIICPNQTYNTTTISACGSYTWLNDAQTYTTSGIYTGTTTNCVTEKLDLTITPSTDNITTITACDTYTWLNNGETYTTSGIYTSTTTNCVTEKLDLTVVDPANFSFEGINYEVTSPTTVAVGSNPSVSGVIVIPTSVSNVCGSYSVTSISDSAFQGCGLTSVTIPNSVISIGANAFEQCTGLASVTIPNSVASIGGFAFLNCSGLTSVICDIATPLSISSNVFQGLYQCSLTVPDGSVAAYQVAPGWQDFDPIICANQTYNTTTASACDTYTWINNGQTYSTSGIYYGSNTNCVAEKLDLTIGDPANFSFEGINFMVTSPTTVAVGNNSGASGVIVIPSSASNACSSYSVTSIGDIAFVNCSSLTSVTIPNSVTSIGFGAFAYSGLTSVTIPNSVTSIGDYAFYDCSSLTSMICDIASPLSISSTVFENVNQAACSLTVPAASVAAYQAAPVWQNFMFPLNNNGSSLNFDGVDDYVGVTAPANLPIGNSNYTMEAWINPSALGDRGIVGWGNWGSDNQSNAFRLSPTGLINYWWANDLVVDYQFSLGTWYHVACSFDGTTRKIYVNGVVIGQDTPVGHSVPNVNFRIGSTNNGEYFNGGIDEVRIWNRGLSQTEIQSSMNCEVQTIGNGLMANYHFNQGNSNDNNASITSLIDSSGNTNNGSLVNFSLLGANSNWSSNAGVFTGVACATVATASSLNFDGVNDYVNCGNSSLLNIEGSISLEAFILRNSINTYDCIIGKDNYSSSTGYSLWIYENNLLALRFGNREYFSTNTINAGTWTHVAGTYADGVVSIYINGILDATYTSVDSPVSNTNALFIGTPQDAVANSFFAFDGTIDEVRIWNRGLTEAEIINKMNCELPANQTGLVAYYQFNQGIDSATNSSVTSLIDASGNSNIGTLNNFALAGTTSNWVGTSSISTGNQCALALPITIVSSQTNVTCNSGGNGEASVAVSGGNTPYSYSWSPFGGTMETASNLSSGTYICTITDAGGAVATRNFTITQPIEPVSGSTVATNATCFGDSNGSINLTPSGGTAPYTYSWTGGITTKDLTGLGAGSYSVIITDYIGCTGTVSVNISEPNALPDNVTTVSACDSYTWNGQTYTSSGIYIGQTTNCVTEKLDLTIATPTSFSFGGINYIVTSPTTVMVGNNAGASGNVVIPATVINACGSFSVTSIGSYAFADCSNLTSVTIPNTVATIGNNAFMFCTSLTSVNIPNSITTIADNTFTGCSSLSSLNLPNSVTFIGDYAFGYCSNLTSVSMPNTLTSIGNYAFGYCSGLTFITIPNLVTNIGYGAFYYCSSLTSVICNIAIPLSIDAAVFGNVNLASCSLTVPNASISAYQTAAVWQNFAPITDCAVITINTTNVSAGCSYTWANNAQTYTTSGLYTGTTLNCVTEKLNLVLVGQPSYFTIGSITYFVTSPTTVSVSSLDVFFPGTLVIPSSVTNGCTTYTVTSIANYSCSSSFGLNSVIIPTSVTSIGDGAFADNLYLSSVTIPHSINFIGNYAFEGCPNLTSLTCNIATPLAINQNVFDGLYQPNCTLILPNGNVSAYQAAPVWQNFMFPLMIPTTKVRASQCGSTLTAINAQIAADIITGTQMYRFEVTNGGSVNAFETTKYNFDLTKIAGSAYGTTYSIRVAVKLINVWGAYGAACNVTTPSIASASSIPTTTLRASICGTTLAALDTPIPSNLVYGAEAYRFEITNGATVTTYDSSIYNFNLTSIAGSSYGTTYYIKVAVKIAGIWGNYGVSCSVATPALVTNTVPLTRVRPTFCGTTLAALNNLIPAVIIANAEGYRFEITKGPEVTVYDTASYNFKLSDAGITPTGGTIYAIRVAAKVNDVYGNYGVSCNVTTPGEAPTSKQAIAVILVGTIDFSLLAYPNPSNNAFKLQVNGGNDDSVSILVFDMTGRQIENKVVKANDIENISLGQNYASGIYNVIFSQGMNTKTVRVIKR